MPLAEVLNPTKRAVSFKGQVENIWVVTDPKTNIQYTCNHSIHCYPFPSWGMQLDDKKGTFYIEPYLGEKPADALIPLSAEGFDMLKTEGTIDDNNVFIVPEDADENSEAVSE